MKVLLNKVGLVMCLLPIFCWIGYLFGWTTVDQSEWRSFIIGSFIWFVPGFVLMMVTTPGKEEDAGVERFQRGARG